jgi:predicted transcriptional regulator
MIDGKSYKTLRRHLSGHGLTPEQYRERFGLKRDYPMVAESYSTARRDMARKIGLGRKKGELAPAKAATDKAAPKAPAKGRRAKKTITEAIQSAKEHLGG